MTPENVSQKSRNPARAISAAEDCKKLLIKTVLRESSTSIGRPKQFDIIPDSASLTKALERVDIQKYDFTAFKSVCALIGNHYLSRLAD